MPKFVDANTLDRIIINLKKLINAKKRFTELTDVPSNYTGDGSKVLRINSTEDGVEFGPRLFVSGASPSAGDGEVGDIWFEV